MSRKLAGKALDAHESDRDIGSELIEAVEELRKGGGNRYVIGPQSAATRARMKTGLSQAEFAKLLGVSKRTLQQWEQGRREPSGAAKTLIKIAELEPHVLRRVEL